MLRILSLLDFLDTSHMLAELKEVSEALEVPMGEPLVPKRIPPTAEKSSETDLLLYLVARFQVPEAERAGHEAALVAVVDPPTGWEAAPTPVLGNRIAAPAQDWFVLPEDHWKTLAGTASAVPGDSWSIPTDTAIQILVHFAPSGETYWFDSTRIRSQSMEAHLVSTKNGLRHIRIKSSLVMAQPWWDHQDDERGECDATGYLVYNEEAAKIESFHMASTEARYVGGSLRPSLSIPFAFGMKLLP